MVIQPDRGATFGLGHLAEFFLKLTVHFFGCGDGKAAFFHKFSFLDCSALSLSFLKFEKYRGAQRLLGELLPQVSTASKNPASPSGLTPQFCLTRKVWVNGVPDAISSGSLSTRFQILRGVQAGLGGCPELIDDGLALRGHAGTRKRAKTRRRVLSQFLGERLGKSVMSAPFRSDPSTFRNSRNAPWEVTLPVRYFVFG